ncbi:Hypothetical predicted protein [Cloeon dipterum]|uniref:Uncharacterized protein n=1 Tax=Cloeon dipterum TaxID=197152 RepID=A0A8S1C7K7_9INSE|nr:Hypothetical predicted protein [Cloeon dipterum]
MISTDLPAGINCDQSEEQDLEQPKEDLLFDPAESREWPASYNNNSEKEVRAAEEAENFLLRLRTDFPQRTPPLLMLKNECGIEKLICTFIRPTAVCHPELGTWQDLASFVADHLAFAPPLEPTKQVSSTYWNVKRKTRAAGIARGRPCRSRNPQNIVHQILHLT